MPQTTEKERSQAARETVTVAVASLMALFAGVVAMWVMTLSSMRDTYALQVSTLTQSVAKQLSASPPASREQTLQTLQADTPQIRYLQLVVSDGTATRVQFDTRSVKERVRAGLELVDDEALQNATEIADREARDGALLRGILRVGDEPVKGPTGYWLAAWAPLLNEQGRPVAALRVVANADTYMARIAEARKTALLGLLPSCLMLLVMALGIHRIRLDRIRLNRNLRKEQGRSRENEQSFRSLFELSPLGISLYDCGSGKFLQVNDALVAATGHSREHLLSLTHDDIAPEAWLDSAPWPAHELAQTHQYGPHEGEVRRSDGTAFSALMTGIGMTDAQGRRVIWSFMQDISQRKLLEQEMAEAARCDRLTGLANRTLFLERLQQSLDAVRTGHQPTYAVLFLDFDRFKVVNDALGHAAGDEMLRQISKRLRHWLDTVVLPELHDSRGSLIARFGGDEFLVLLNTLDNAAAAIAVADSLIVLLRESYVIHGRDVYSTASIGIVTAEQCMDTAEAVVRNADVAMYEAKHAGRACHVLFDEAMHVRLTRRIAIEEGLRRALGTEQLALVYQPVVSLETGRTVAVEALLRWNHPTMGAISPTEFIPVAEESGLIVAIGEWVLQQACRMLADWRISNAESAPLVVSVNVSRAELALGDRLMSRVRDVLADTSLPASCLQLEVTEREVMRDPESSQQLMIALRALGVRLAMDDFGTGTSSLACLRDYPFDVIKIDRSFLRDISTRPDVMALVHATLLLIENLGRETVAEGVENAEQVAALQSLGCRYAQGYYFARPQASINLSLRSEYQVQQPAA